ncbi:adenylyl-sulfate kinase [Endothiovibrio diazotrophicus]
MSKPTTPYTVVDTAEKSSNTVWHNATVTRKDRERLNSHGSAVLWFTGLSGAGKSTLANAVEERLHQMNCRTHVLDGDNVRHGLCSDLSFSDEDRVENVRRVGEVSKLMVDAGVMVLTAFISPFRSDRQRARDIMGEGDFIEVFCHADLSVCESRDVKGLYARARKGEIPHFTGISSPYETPENPEIAVDTGAKPLNECVDQVIDYLIANGYLQPAEDQCVALAPLPQEEIAPGRPQAYAN